MMLDYGIDSVFASSFRIDWDGFAFALALPCLGALSLARGVSATVTVVAWVLGSA